MMELVSNARTTVINAILPILKLVLNAMKNISYSEEIVLKNAKKDTMLILKENVKNVSTTVKYVKMVILVLNVNLDITY